MKKILITCFALISFVFPLLAQVDHDYNANDRVPVVSYTLSKDQIPASVIKSARTDFQISEPGTWARFPYALQEYGWVYDKGAADLHLDHYSVRMRTNTGGELYAIYATDGTLIESRETATNILLPASVRDALAQSQYKDWKVVGNNEIIKYYHDKKNVEQHFRVTVEKDKERRSISFNYQGPVNE